MLINQNIGDVPIHDSKYLTEKLTTNRFNIVVNITGELSDFLPKVMRLLLNYGVV